MTDLADSVDAGLLDRFRAAGGRIAWRDLSTTKKGKRRGDSTGGVTRIAHLNDEEARVEERPDGTRVVESGPVGALVLLLEADRRGLPTAVLSRSAGEVQGFDHGAIEARWDRPSLTPAAGPTLSDLVGLARYALA